MPDALFFLAIVALVAVASSRRRQVAGAALRWLTGESRRADGSLRGRAVRSGRRAGGSVAALGAAWGTTVDPVVTLPVLAVLAAGGTAYGVYRGRAWQRQRSHHRRWVRPAYMAAQDIARWPDGDQAGKWLTVAPDRSLAVAKLPVGWKGEAADQARLTQVLSTRLGIDSPVIRWQLAGHAPKLELAKSPPPPGRTVFADALGVVEHAKPDELVYGRGKRGAWVTASLSGDSPHLGISMGSGAGKSTLARWLLAQMLHRGCIGLILDTKWLSHMWAEGLPNVAIAHRPADIHEALLWLGHEVERRNRVAFAGADIEGRVGADVGPRIIVLCEELNDTMKALRGWWREEGRGKSDPPRPPSLDALDRVSFTGRQVLVHLVYIGQALSAAAMGGGRDSTENVGVIAFARTRPRTWNMLAPEHPMPKMSRTPGRIYVVSDEVREAQAVLATGAEAREYALSGAVAALPSTLPAALVRAGATAVAGPVQAGFPPAEPSAATGTLALATAPATTLVSLREAVEARLLGRVSLAAARTARARDPQFPAAAGRDGITDLYQLQALIDWAGARTNERRSA